MKTLFIDTSSNEKIIIGLFLDDQKHLYHRKLDFHKSQIALELIEELLRRHNLSLKDINSVEVNAGPGSFTGARVGVSIANALGFALNIPVNGKKGSVEPIYN